MARVAQRYRLISGDSHVNEPPGVWADRVPAALKDRAPRMRRFEQGDAWVIEGADDPINFGNNACAGLEPDQMRSWVNFEDIRAGGYDPAARCAELDRDGVDAEVLFPTPRLSQGVFATKDVELHGAMVRAYNDWLSEFASYAPDRLLGLAFLNNRGVDRAIAELERSMELPGIRSVLMGCYPNGTLEIEPEDDKVWGRIADMGIPLNIHVSLSDSMPKAHSRTLHGAIRFSDIYQRIIQFMVSGVLDRFPQLQIVCAEVDCGWVPYLKEQLDNNYQRVRLRQSFDFELLPSEYIDRQFSFSYITDTFAIQNRHRIGVDRMLWSSDYPHGSSDWPNSWRTIQASFSGVPNEERDLILAGNHVRLFNL